MKRYELQAGVATTFEQAIRFADWCDHRSTRPNANVVMITFGVSRPTACRWLAAWRAARGTSARDQRIAA